MAMDYTLDASGTAIPTTTSAREAFIALQQAVNAYAAYYGVKDPSLPLNVDGLWGKQTHDAIHAVKQDYDARGFPVATFNPEDRTAAARAITGAIAKVVPGLRKRSRLPWVLAFVGFVGAGSVAYFTWRKHRKPARNLLPARAA